MMKGLWQQRERDKGRWRNNKGAPIYRDGGIKRSGG